jgi:hypothetical protein
MPRLENLPKNSTVFLTFTNGHYSELMLNSLATIAVMGLPAFAYCFDSVAVQLCHELGIPYLHPEHGRMMESSDFRQNRAKFLEMGVHKPEMVERLFHGEHDSRSSILSYHESHRLGLPFVWELHKKSQIFLNRLSAK